MKKIKLISLVLALVMVLGLFAGCGNKTAEETKAPAAANADPQQPTPPLLPPPSPDPSLWASGLRTRRPKPSLFTRTPMFPRSTLCIPM